MMLTRLVNTIIKNSEFEIASSIETNKLYASD